MNMAEVRFGSQCRATRELLPDEAVDVLVDIVFNLLSRYRARELLREVRLAPCPVVDTVQCLPGLLCVEVQFGCEYVEIVPREVLEGDRLRHVKWRELGLIDQTHRIALAQQHECQARELGLHCPPVMRGADAGQQLRTDRVFTDALYLVDKNHDPLLDEAQHDFVIELEQPLIVAEHRFVLPPGLQVITDAQLSQYSISNAVIPSTGIGTRIALTDLAEIEHGHIKSLGFESHRGGRYQAGLAATAGSDNVSVTPCKDGIVKQVIRRSAHVTGAHGMQRLADAEKFASRVPA